MMPEKEGGKSRGNADDETPGLLALRRYLQVE